VKKLLISSLLVLFIFILAGCSTQNQYLRKDHQQTDLVVDMFKNQSFQPGLEEKLTRILSEEFLSDGRYHLVNEDISSSGIRLKGTITQYTRNIISVDANDKVTLYQISLTVNIEAHKADKSLAYNGITLNTTYVPLRDNIDFETEFEAQERLMEDLAEEISYKVSKDIFSH